MSDAISTSTPSDSGQPNRRRQWFLFAVWSFSFFVAGLLLVAFLNRAVVWSSSDTFCGQFCHSMIWASAAYKRAPHYQNAVGVQASCGNCHIPYDTAPSTAFNFIYLLGFKADRGAKDFYGEATHSMPTKEVWEQRRPALAATFETFLKGHNYITCRGCHQIDSFSKGSTMSAMIHAKYITANDYNCLHCHSDVGHVYEETTPAAGAAAPALTGTDWYAAEQAQGGSQLYEKNCSSCHGAKLEGGAGPSLVGASWKGLFGGKKLLTPWGQIHGPMAQYAGTTFTEQQSLDILAYLLHENGYPAGGKPLTDPGTLSRRIPKN